MNVKSGELTRSEKRLLGLSTQEQNRLVLMKNGPRPELSVYTTKEVHPLLGNQIGDGWEVGGVSISTLTSSLTK